MKPSFPTLEHVDEAWGGEPPELDWLDAALQGQPRAVLWRSAPALVAPGSYRRHARLGEAMDAFAARGWPVRLRRSGGGVVPQGPGILNLSLVYAVEPSGVWQAEAVYQHLCGVLQRALAGLGIESDTREVQGSFCDGRYNLAVGSRKIAGTAQYWRRSGGAAGGPHAVLAHALLLVDADLEALTAITNEFEAMLDSGRVYRADALTSIERECRATPAEGLEAAFRNHLAGALGLPPG